MSQTLAAETILNLTSENSSIVWTRNTADFAGEEEQHGFYKIDF